MLKHLVLLVLFPLSACGSSRGEGDTCSTENTATCADSSTVLICEGKTLHAYPCRGPKGCVSTASTAVCDFSGSVAGEGCPNINAAKALCNSQDADHALICTDNIWTDQVCIACAVKGGEVLCNNK